MKYLLLLAGGLLVAGAQLSQAQQPSAPGKAASQPELPRGRRNPASQPLERIYQRYDSVTTSWANADRDYFEAYNAAGRPERFRSYLWQNNAWQSFSDYHAYSDATGQRVLLDTLLVYRNTPVPTPIWAQQYDYAGGLLRTQTFISNAAGRWQPLTRYAYSYDAAGRLTQQLTEGISATPAQPYDRQLFSYDAQGRLLSQEYQTPGSAAGTWLSGGMSLYTYDAQGNVYQQIKQGAWPPGSSYVNQQRETYQYNAAGYLSTTLLERWDNGSWRNFGRNVYTYDAQGNLLEQALQDWRRGSYEPGYRYVYTYRTATATRTERSAKPVLRVAPNPVTAQSRLYVQAPQRTAAGQGEVLDRTGRVVARFAVPGLPAAEVLELPLPLQGLTGGLYVVRVQAGGAVVQTRLAVP